MNHKWKCNQSNSNAKHEQNVNQEIRNSLNKIDSHGQEIIKPIKRQEISEHDTRKQQTPPEAGPLATSRYCYVTSNTMREQKLNYVLIIELK